ncbi:hypothetical protein [Paenarthrobacter sp. 2TAF44]|uniref:hypothetical protein n=1 Tax=Paenarthrobacter sp. 2TAF44 TaxID=3233018 RepID=UPI003F9E5304
MKQSNPKALLSAARTATRKHKHNTIWTLTTSQPRHPQALRQLGIVALNEALACANIAL